MNEHNFAPITSEDAEILAKIIREKALTTSESGGNIGNYSCFELRIYWLLECVVSEENIVSNRFLLSASTDFLHVACFDVCALSEPYKESGNYFQTFLLLSFHPQTLRLKENLYA